MKRFMRGEIDRRAVILILIILLVFGALGAGPWWGGHTYGYYPSGGLGLLVLVLVLLLIFGVI